MCENSGIQSSFSSRAAEANDDQLPGIWYLLQELTWRTWYLVPGTWLEQDDKEQYTINIQCSYMDIRIRSKQAIRHATTNLTVPPIPTYMLYIQIISIHLPTCRIQGAEVKYVAAWREISYIMVPVQIHNTGSTGTL